MLVTCINQFSGKMQEAMDQVSQSRDNYVQPVQRYRGFTPTCTGKPYNEPAITVNGKQLKVVDTTESC